MLPVRQRRWTLRAQPPAPHLVLQLAESLQISELLAAILCRRGYATSADARLFLQSALAMLPDPDLLPDIDKACQRLQEALESGERISVHGDYDVDGISGCTLLVEALRAFGGQVDYHIPLRLIEGYGLSADAIRQVAAQGCQLVVSVDCGISAHAEAKLAQELGVDLIVTDHHQPGDTLPPAIALVNPQLPANRYPYTQLAGVGVAFMLLVALRKRLRECGYFNHREEPDLRHLLDLVALGTIADIAPLTGVNRILVKTGLQLLEKGGRCGVAALKNVSGVTAVTSGSVGFQLAPRLNAAGRLEDAALGVKLLLGEAGIDVQKVAQQLDQFNQERRALEKKVLADAITRVEADQQQRRSIVLAGSDWHSGVIGIVASRLVDRYHRPTFLIALDQGVGKGSGRSIKGFDLYLALKDCGDLLEGYGGHTMAAGLTIAEHQLAEFSRRFEQVASERLTDELCTPVIEHDGECCLDLWSVAAVQELKALEPFGVGNPQPLFLSRRCTVRNCSLVAEKHLKFDVEQLGTIVSAIAFGCGERFAECAGELDILYRPQLNVWRGNTKVQMQVVDFCRAGGQG
ncbi:MAG: single-stranded-DNA-specific exonuclease RecJ [Desulfuromonadales bacterium]|nr:single-stranded-DNA-specific exonuclease RecJ [Desulfuromonadales bacterium]